MDAVFLAAQASRHILIDFHDNDLGALAAGSQMGCARAEIEVTVGIHRRHLKSSYPGRTRQIPVVSGKLGITDRRIEGISLRCRFPLDPPHMPGVPCQMFCRVFDFKNLRFPHEDTAAEFYVSQVVHPPGKRGVERNRRIHAPAIIYPVPGTDCFCGFLSRVQLAFV